MDAMEKRVLRRKAGIVAEVVQLTDVLAQDAMRQGILRERDFARVMTRARNRERVFLFLEYLEKVRPAAFEKLCYFLENHGYSGLCDELLVELICEKGHLQIDAAVLVEARAIVRHRLGEKKRLDEADIEELISLIATRYQIAKDTAARQQKRPRKQKALDVKSVKENVKDLCDELERCMLLSRGPSRVESSRAPRAPSVIGYSPLCTPRPHSSVGPDLKSERGKGIDSWVHSLKQKLYRLTSAYRQAADVIEDESEGASHLTSPTLTSMGGLGEQPERADRKGTATRVRFQSNAGKNAGKPPPLQRQKSAFTAPSSASSGASSAKAKGFFGKSGLGKPPPLAGKPPKHDGPSSKAASSTKDSKSTKSKSTKSTSSKDSSEHQSTKSHKSSHKTSGHGGSDVGHQSVTGEEELVPALESEQPSEEAKPPAGRRGVRGQLYNLRVEGADNGDDSGSEVNYAPIPTTGSARGRNMEDLRREQRQLIKHRRHIRNIRRLLGKPGEGGEQAAGTVRMEEQYWQKRYETMKKSQSVGYYYFLSERRRDRCGACNTASCSKRDPSRWDCAWWYQDPKAPNRNAKSRTELNLYDPSFGFDLESDDGSLFDDEECPGAIALPGSRRRRCLACAYANRELPEFFDACVSPHGRHHFHFPPISAAGGDKTKSAKEGVTFNVPPSGSDVNVVVVN